MTQDTLLEAKRSRRPLVGFIVTLGALALVAIGTSVQEAVTVNQASTHFLLSVSDVSRIAQIAVIALVAVAASALVAARATAQPLLALAATAACALVLGVAVYVLAKADNPSVFLEDAFELSGRPLPATGFYLIFMGGILGAVSSLSVALTARH